MIVNVLTEIWMVWSQMAPYLILGFAIAGALSIWIKPDFIQKHIGKGSFLPILKTTIFGVPLPLCSCGVIPVAASLRKNGASKGATTAFLLSTPQTGVDSIAVTYSLMGLFFAVFRALTAFISGIIGGLIISFFDKDSAEPIPVIEDKPCCSTCGSDTDTKTTGTFTEALRYGFIVLPKDIGRALILGVIIAGAISAFFPPDLFVNIPGGTWTQMLFMLGLGIPVYVCATSSVPVAAALILKGISPGAALVFLIAGPATNAAAISTIWKIMGRHTAVIYLLVVAVFALISGFAADFLLETVPDLGHLEIHEHSLNLIEHMFGAILLLIVVVSRLKKSS